MKEIWKPVVGFVGRYEVSDAGRIKSLTPRGYGTILRCSLTKKGYCQVGLSGSSHALRVHHLVLDAFVGPRPPGTECSHLNGVRTDNRVANLKWATSKENKAMMRVHGTLIQGSRIEQSKLKESDIPIIRGLLARGLNCGSVAKMYGLGRTAIAKIKYGQTWSHVKVAAPCFAALVAACVGRM